MSIAIEGTADGPFWRVANTLERQLARGGGAAACVYHRGRKVVDIWGGSRGSGRPWLQDTMAMSFSTSKGIVSTLIHILVDRGDIDYDEPVATYWPSFADNGKQAITVREAMSHRAGLARLRPLISFDNSDSPRTRITKWNPGIANFCVLCVLPFRSLCRIRCMMAMWSSPSCAHSTKSMP